MQIITQHHDSHIRGLGKRHGSCDPASVGVANVGNSKKLDSTNRTRVLGGLVHGRCLNTSTMSALSVGTEHID